MNVKEPPAIATSAEPCNRPSYLVKVTFLLAGGTLLIAYSGAFHDRGCAETGAAGKLCSDGVLCAEIIEQ